MPQQQKHANGTARARPRQMASGKHKHAWRCRGKRTTTASRTPCTQTKPTPGPQMPTGAKTPGRRPSIFHRPAQQFNSPNNFPRAPCHRLRQGKPTGTYPIRTHPKPAAWIFMYLNDHSLYPSYHHPHLGPGQSCGNLAGAGPPEGKLGTFFRAWCRLIGYAGIFNSHKP